MGKIRKFLGFLTFFIGMIFAANSFATGYVCDDIKMYTSCNSGYYLSACGTEYDGRELSEDDLTTGNSCMECPSDDYTCAGGLTCPSLKTVTISFSCGDGELKPGVTLPKITAKLGEEVSLEGYNPAEYCHRNGYYADTNAFVSAIIWTDKDTGIIVGNMNYTITATSDMEFLPEWKPNDLALSFYRGDRIISRDYINTDDYVCSYGEKYTIPSYEQAGYDFNGEWTSENTSKIFKPGDVVDCTYETFGSYGFYSLNEANNFDYKSNDGEITSEIPTSDKLITESLPITYLVRFNANGGSGTMDDQELEYGEYSNSTELNANKFTRTGYTFMGWSTTETGSVEYTDGEWVSNLTTEDGAVINLYAVWEPACNKLQMAKKWLATGDPQFLEAWNTRDYLYFKTDDNTVYTDSACTTEYSSADYSDVIPTVKPSSGLKFMGWAVSANTDINYVSALPIHSSTYVEYMLLDEDGEIFGGDPLTGFNPIPKYLYAVFASDCVTDSPKGTCNQTITKSTDTSTLRVQYDVECANGYNKEDVDLLGTLAESDLSVCIGNEYTVSFNANGGSGGQSSSVTATYGSEMPEISTTAPTRTGYTFMGWYDNADYNAGKMYYTVAGESARNYDNTSNTTLYAGWAPCTYSVKYNANDGSGTMSDSSHTYDISKNLSANTFTRTGYNFLGWSTDNSATYTNEEAVINLTATCGGTVNLYAVWDPITFTIEYLGGDGATGSMDYQTCTYDTDCFVANNEFEKTNYNFTEWECSGGACDGDMVQPDDNLTNATATDGAVITLTAQWSLGVSTCTAGQTYDEQTCPEGSYCPGENVPAGTESGDNGCARKCPVDILRGGTVSSGEGSDSRSDCYTTRENTATPNGTGRGDQVCEYGVNAAKTDNYAGDCTVVINWCQGGMYLQANDDSECKTTSPGEYSPEGDTKKYFCNDLKGANDTTSSQAGAKSATECFNRCSANAITNGVQNPIDYVVEYNGTEFPACKYETSCNGGYVVDGDACQPDVFKITLNHNGGVPSVNTIYLKYNTGWYSDETANTPITSIPLPTDETKTCSGYYYNNTQMIVGADGKLTTDYKVFDDDAEIVASWDAKPTTTCAAGTYYTGTGTTCATCIEGNYCPGVQNVIQGSGQAGMFTCASLKGSYVPATDASGNVMTVEINSAAGADSASDCFATNVEYKTTYATGAQKCYYNSGAYNDKCTDKSVFTCIAGYYYDAEKNSTDCIIVGRGYYSPKDSKTRGMCPGFGTDSEVTTDDEDSDSITLCKRGNTAKKIVHGYMRARCTHKSDAPSDLTDVSGYQDNCPLGVVVTCDAGYYDDKTYQGTEKTPYCVQVEADYWSPDQATCSGSDDIPMAENPGCSTLKTACAAGSTTNGVTGATSAEACKWTTCEPGMVCEDGKEPQSCSKLTGGEFTLSEAGTTSVDRCFKTCETECVEPDSCPTNFRRCEYKTGAMISGIQYYGTNECTTQDPYCSIKHGSQTYCESPYYLSEEHPDCSASCSSLEPEGFYNSSSSPTLQRAETACKAWCDPSSEDASGRKYCDFSAAYVFDINGNLTDETKNWCPEHATCTDYIPPTTGYAWYPAGVCVPTSLCKFTFVCDPGYVANTESAVAYGQAKSSSGGVSSSSDIATCTPGTYMVTLDDNGGNGGAGAVYQKYTVGWSLTDFGDLVDRVSVPTRDGYTFKGYYDAKTDGNLVIGTDGMLPANDKFTDDTTLYAQWDLITYTITYDNMDGATNNIANPSSYTIEQTPMSLANPEKRGYTFTGWTGDAISDNTIVEGTTGNLTITANWKANTFVVHFDTTDATETVVPNVECTYDEPCNAAAAIELLYNTFSGWNTAPDGKGTTYDGGADITNIVASGEITLYAIWNQNKVACHAGKYYESGVEKTCPKGQYCPGNGQINEGSTGCIEECPDDGATTRVKDGGASNIAQCRKVVSGSEAKQTFTHGTARWDCAYNIETGEYTLDCDAVPLTCDAGFYYEFEKQNYGCTTVENGYYSPVPVVPDGEKDEASMERYACPGKLYDDGTTSNGIGSVGLRASITDCTSVCALTIADVLNSKTVTADSEKVKSDANGVYPACSYTIVCHDGYTEQDGTDPECIAKEYTITLDTNGGVGDVDASIKCTFGSGKCALPSTNTLTRAGYVTANQWCEYSDGSGECYTAGENTVENISDKGDDTTLYAIWNPGVFKVELVADDATENENKNPVYLKYTVGWYSDSGAENKLTSIEGGLPGKSGYIFAGYKLGDVMIVDASGKPISTDAALRATTSDAVANVTWANGSTTCEAGYYYPGNGGAENCKVCEANHWCPGDTFGTDTGNIGGHNECPDGGLSAGGVTATNAGVCYKEGLPYTSITKRATGTQTCYYDDTDGKKVYDARCEDKVVNTCIGGYYRANDTDEDCTEVGENYYSPDTSIKRIACPDNGITGEKTTATEAGECYKTVPYTATNGSGTMVCNYTKQNDDGSALYNTDPRDWFINKCNPGYYRVAETDKDCVEIERNFYGPVNEVYKEPCPMDEVSGKRGVTNTTRAPSAGFCYVEEQKFESEHGDGVQRCDYNQEDRVYDMCGKRKFHHCDPGYYWDRKIEDDCVPVDYRHFGPVADESNPGYYTARQECPTFDGREGQTEDEYSADASECYMTEVPCGNASTGTGTRTCNYDESAQSYSDTCTTTCEIDGCPSGHYLDSASNACIECPAGMICGPETGVEGGEDPKACKDMFDGRYPNSDAGSSSTGQCYGTCDIATNASTMMGRDYQNDALDTCEVKTCLPGYDLENGKCVKCDEGKYCPGDADGDGENDGEAQSCPTSHPNSDAGNTDMGKCYTACAKSPNASTMMGRDYQNDALDTCEVKTCLPGYRLNGGTCTKCGDGEV